MGIVALGLVDVLRYAKHSSVRWALWGTRALVAATLITFVSVSTYDYFVRWPRSAQVRYEYQAPVTAVARYLLQHPTESPTCVSAPYVDYWNPWSVMNFDLHVGGTRMGVRWFDGQQAILFPAGSEALFFLPDHLFHPSGLDDDLGALLMSGAQPVQLGYQDRIGAGFDLYRWSDAKALEARLASVALAPLWASPETVYVPGTSELQRQRLDLPVDVGHRLSLLGYAYERGGAEAGTAWQVTTFWRVQDPASRPLAVFVHVLDDANGVRAGWDGLYVSPETWQAGDRFAHVHTLMLPADTPKGVLRVEIGVYSPVTLERLTLYAADGDITAPYGRALLRALVIE
jgi:hypothetical protein